MKKLLLLSALLMSAKSELSVSVLGGQDCPIHNSIEKGERKTIKSMDGEHGRSVNSLANSAARERRHFGLQLSYRKDIKAVFFGASTGVAYNCTRISGIGLYVLSPSKVPNFANLVFDDFSVSKVNVFVGPDFGWYFSSKGFVKAGVNAVFLFAGYAGGESKNDDGTSVKKIEKYSEVFYGIAPKLSVGYDFTECFRAELFVAYSHVFNKKFERKDVTRVDKHGVLTYTGSLYYHAPSAISTGLALTYKILK